MLKEYIDDILNSSKTFDARAYPTNYRGEIALVQSHKNVIYGYVKLIECREISFEDFLLWHNINPYEYIENLKFLNLTNINVKKYYAYIFSDPVKLKQPILIYKRINQHVFFNYEDNDLIPKNKNDEEDYNLFTFENHK